MSSVLQNKKCLVLNKNWRPISAISLEDAICKVFSFYEDGTPKAKIIEPRTYQTFTWEDWSKIKPNFDEEKLVSSSCVFRVPEIILLSKYEKIPKPATHFSRRTLYKRDKNQCQYCGCRPGTEELTIEHVVPKSQGGGTNWENCVLACVKCNSKKANRTPQQAKMKLLKEPKKPKLSIVNFDGYKRVKSWEGFLGTAYWNVGLEN